MGTRAKRMEISAKRMEIRATRMGFWGRIDPVAVARKRMREGCVRPVRPNATIVEDRRRARALKDRWKDQAGADGGT
jgi:hypothetical protein